MTLADLGPKALLEQAQSGDGGTRAALSELLSRLYPKLLAYLRGLAADKGAAEDACQEAMVRIVTHLPGFTPRQGTDAWSSFLAWAFTVAGNAYKDYVRKSSRVTPVAEVPEGGLHVQAAENEAIEEMGARSLMDTLGVLPVEQRQVFLLKAYYGYSYGEIARIAGCPEGTAKSRLHHAVRALRDELKGSGAL